MEWGWELVFQLAVLLGGSGVLGVAIKGFLERKKMSVDAGAAISTVALATVTATQKDMDDMKADMIKLRKALREHDAWDRKVVRQLHNAGIEVEAPPEIWVL